MNEPIINPWLIYWLGRIDNLKFLLGIFMILGGVVFWYQALTYIDDSDLYLLRGEEYEAKKHNKKKKFRVASLFLIVVFILQTMTPSSTTLVKMWVASKITPANIQEAGVVTADIAQKALDLITDSAIKIIQEVKK